MTVSCRKCASAHYCTSMCMEIALELHELVCGVNLGCAFDLIRYCKSVKRLPKMQIRIRT